MPRREGMTSYSGFRYDATAINVDQVQTFIDFFNNLAITAAGPNA